MPFAAFETSSASPRVPSQCKLGPSPPHRSPPRVHKSPPRTRTRAHSPPRVRHSIWEIQRAPRDVLQPRSHTLTERPSTSPCPAAGSPKSRTATTPPPTPTHSDGHTRRFPNERNIFRVYIHAHPRATSPRPCPSRPLPVCAPAAPAPAPSAAALRGRLRILGFRAPSVARGYGSARSGRGIRLPADRSHVAS